MEEDFRAEDLLFMMKKISLDLAAQMDQCLKNSEMTGVQVYFLVYILRHHSKGTYLTELCREIGVSKATLSALIKRMREKEYLYFLEDPGDVRKKKVLPTAKLIAGEMNSSGRRNKWRLKSAARSTRMSAGSCGTLRRS